MKYNIYILLLLFVFVLPSAQAQKNTKAISQEQVKKIGKPAQRPKFSSQEYMERKNSFLTKNAHLTTSEASDVLPLLHRQKELQRANDSKIRDLRKQVNINSDDAKCLSILKQIRSLQENNYKLELEYQKKMLKKVSSLKYLLLINADVAFDREMLHKIMAPHKGNQPRNKKLQNGKTNSPPVKPASN